FHAPHPHELYTLSLHDALPISSTRTFFRNFFRFKNFPSLLKIDPRLFNFPGCRILLAPCATLPAPPVNMSSRADNTISKTPPSRSEEHTSELQSRENLVCRLLL